ncbi:Resolvase, N terminal domain [Cohaesibacter gelatinilyticus]|uniref:Resolvase, N terminal domain n=1 Tax=Cohaesibacter gelatinilyticus TaxID=372072 RepID=A0A285PF77_9HYPH|nr:Resolvase, N terminal domain [Cohaesibacter gelatinilyticus]
MNRRKPNNSRQSLGVALLRVSTDRQFQEGESIETQRRKTEFVARRDGIDIVRFFTEHYSGRKSDRRVLDDLFDFLEENDDIEVVIVGDIDRFTRGGTETYLALKRQLRSMDVALLDTTGIIQPERNRLEHLGVEYGWSVESPSHFAEVFMAEKAKTEASDILTRTIGQQIQLTREGYQCRGANFGFRNAKITTGDGKKKTIMVPHEIEAPWIIKMYELRADGSWADDAICEAINAMGYQSRPMNIYDKETRRVIGQTKPKHLTPKQLERFVSRTIYCGVKCESWNQGKPVKAPIEPLVSISLFNQANRGKVQIKEHRDGSLSIEENRLSYTKTRHNADFLLRHVVLCHECGKPVVASRSKGKSGNYFGYYHCNRGHKHWGVNKAEFEQTIANYLKSLQAKPGFLPLFREVVRDVWIQKNRSFEEDRKLIETHVNDLKDRQNSILDRIIACTTEIAQTRLEAELEQLEVTIKETRKKLNSKQLREDQIDAFFEIAKKRMEHPEETVFSSATKPQLEKNWSFIFAQSPSYQNLLDGTPQLTLLYRLNRDGGADKNLLAGQLSLGWNTFEQQVISFLE